MDAKRRKLYQPVTEDSRTDFLSMNNDCIYKIFEWLDLDDICSISDTCKQLKMLSSDYFQRKYHDKLVRGMRIVAVDGKIQLQPNEKYVWSFSRCFDKVIANVDTRLTRNLGVSKHDLPVFIRENCNDYLSSIQFESMFLYHSIGESITNVLENVGTVVFTGCDLEGTYHQILKHCPNLKYLIVEENYGHKIEQLLLETYPKLEQFICRYYGRVLMKKNLKIFLRQHPKLKRLTWCFHARIREATFSDKTLECIEMIVKNGKNLEELFLSFDGTYNLESICDKLTVLCDRKHFKRLELDFRFTTLGYKLSKMMIDHGHHMSNLKSLLGLHLCEFSDFGNTFLPALCTMKNLRVLQLDTVASIKRLNAIPLDGLSCLEELHVGTLADFKFVQQFVCQLKTLKIISILRCRFTISRFDLPMLNIERKKLLLDGSVLSIYVDIVERKKIVDDGMEGDVVKIEFVEFEVKRCNFDNPFIRRGRIFN